MNMRPVKSSNVTHVGYENGILGVKFNSGSEYHYDGLSPAHYEAMVSAPSVGKYLREVVISSATSVRKIA